MNRQTFEALYPGYHEFCKSQGWPTVSKEQLRIAFVFYEVVQNLPKAKATQEKKAKKGKAK